MPLYLLSPKSATCEQHHVSSPQRLRTTVWLVRTASRTHAWATTHLDPVFGHQHISRLEISVHDHGMQIRHRRADLASRVQYIFERFDSPVGRGAIQSIV